MRTQYRLEEFYARFFFQRMCQVANLRLEIKELIKIMDLNGSEIVSLEGHTYSNAEM